LGRQRYAGKGIGVDLAFVRRRLRELREQLGLTQEQVADRADLSKNFVSAMERGAKSFGMETFLRYVEALGLSPGQVLQTGTEAIDRDPLTTEEHVLLQHYRQLSQADRGRIRLCINYLRDVHETIRSLARQQLDVLERAVYAERLTTGDDVSPEANDPPAG
jgi:transcriptional regulator with XRE-family HTH domain